MIVIIIIIGHVWIGFVCECWFEGTPGSERVRGKLLLRKGLIVEWNSLGCRDGEAFLFHCATIVVANVIKCYKIQERVFT